MTLASRRQEIKWVKTAHHGEHNPNFGGGQYIDKKGYTRVLMPDHPESNAGYVYMHRLVVERWIGRQLLETEVVHHINEIKCDNRRENLFLTTVPEHSAIHRAGKRKSLEQKTNMRRKTKARKSQIKTERNTRGQFVKSPPSVVE